MRIDEAISLLLLCRTLLRNHRHPCCVSWGPGSPAMPNVTWKRREAPLPGRYHAASGGEAGRGSSTATLAYRTAT